MAKVARRIFEKQGLSFKLSTKVTSAEIDRSIARVMLQDNKGDSEISADRILVAVGRVPYSEGLGLEKLGVKQDQQGRVLVDHQFSTNVQGVRAIGDLIPGPILAHKAE